jgi:hypothetical protein
VDDLGAHYALIERQYRIDDARSELKVQKLSRKSTWAMRSCHIDVIYMILI